MGGCHLDAGEFPGFPMTGQFYFTWCLKLCCVCGLCSVDVHLRFKLYASWKQDICPYSIIIYRMTIINIATKGSRISSIAISGKFSATAG